MKFNLASSLFTATLLPLSTLWLLAADPAPSDTDSGTETYPTYQQPPVGETAQMEASKRHQLLVGGTQAVADAQRLLDDHKYDDAAARFQYAVDALATGGISAPIYDRATAGLAAAKFGQADAAAKDNRFAQAAALIQQAITLQPGNAAYPQALKELKRQQMVFEEQLHDPEGTQNNPAVTPKFVETVSVVQKLLLQGNNFFNTGQYEKAEEDYAKILILDPYNKTARERWPTSRVTGCRRQKCFTLKPSMRR